MYFMSDQSTAVTVNTWTHSVLSEKPLAADCAAPLLKPHSDTAATTDLQAVVWRDLSKQDAVHHSSDFFAQQEKQ